MKKNKLFLTAVLLCGACLHAQDLSVYTASPAGSVTFADWVLSDWVKTEVPPWTIAGGWHSYFFVDGINSFVGSAPLDLISNSTIDMLAHGYGPVTATSPDGCTAANMFPWRRNYYAIYSAQEFNDQTAGAVSMGFLHGENHSVIGVNQPLVSCDGIGYPSFAAFVCGSWTPYTAATNWGTQYFTDIGPLVWPSTGYLLPSGQKSSLGCSVPSSIQADDGYMYLFYKDGSHYRVPSYGTPGGRPGFPPYYAGDPDFQWEDGRHPGIKVARAPIGDALNPQAYMSFYEDASGVHWNPSLPAGFTMSNTTAFLRTQGPQASNIMGIENEGHKDYVRFSAAKVRGTNYYYGVANYQDYDDKWVNAHGDTMPKLKTSLRYSYDLVHWTGNLVIDVTNDWTTTHFDYPIFLSSDGRSNTSIDPSDFYVIGTSPSTINHTVYKMHIYIPAPPPPPPPPPPPGHGCPIQTVCQAPPAISTAGVSFAIDNAGNSAAVTGILPNPSHGIFQVAYTLTGPGRTQVNILDMTGRKIVVGSSAAREAGHYTENIDISNAAKGIYLVELQVNGGRKAYKVLYY